MRTMFTNWLFYPILQLLEKIMQSQAQLAAALRTMKDQNEKATAEILAKVAALEAVVAAGGNTTPEVDTAFEELRASIQRDDDIVPDTTA